MQLWYSQERLLVRTTLINLIWALVVSYLKSRELNLLKSSFFKNANREAQLLLSDAENRYLWFCREYPQRVKKLPQYQIASFLGVTPVTLSWLKLNRPEL